MSSGRRGTLSVCTHLGLQGVGGGGEAMGAEPGLCLARDRITFTFCQVTSLQHHEAEIVTLFSDVDPGACLKSHS